MELDFHYFCQKTIFAKFHPRFPLNFLSPLDQALFAPFQRPKVLLLLALVCLKIVDVMTDDVNLLGMDEAIIAGI